MLVILDNCEHVLEGTVQAAAQMLSSAPDLRILTTSRERLSGAGERVIDVPPLSSPRSGEMYSEAEAAQFESVRLLVDRASAASPLFELTDETVGDVAELCARLEGNPLSIELAAVRLRSLSASDLLARLTDQLTALGPGDSAAPIRHRSLRGMIDWSWNLCTPAERWLWSRASVFAGSFGLDSAEQVCAFGELAATDVAELLDHLVAKSLVKVEFDPAGTRYRFLETLRQYGNAKLGDELPRLRRRHRDHFAERARRALADWPTARQAQAMEGVRRDRGEFIRAVQWSFGTPGEEAAGAEIVNALRYHWAVAGDLAEGRSLLHESLERNREATRQRGTTMWIAAWVALASGDQRLASRLLSDAEELAAELGSKDIAAYVHALRGAAALFRGDLAEGRVALARGSAELEKVGETAGYLLHSMQHVILLAQMGLPSEAQAEGARALDVSALCGELWGRQQTLWALGYNEWLNGDTAKGLAKVLQALDMRLSFNRVGIALDLECLAWIAESQAMPQRATRLFAGAARLWAGLGTTVVAFGVEFGKHTSSAIERLSSPAHAAQFERLTAEVKAWSFDEVLTYALTDKVPSRDEPAAMAEPVKLTRREREVSALIAEGLSNREIASRLTISARTVEGHVENLLVKLGYRSRVQIASWIASAQSGQGGEIR
jgi:predicted ATPase/DNA-binding CsgD family transcriptional regulator